MKRAHLPLTLVAASLLLSLGLIVVSQGVATAAGPDPQGTIYVADAEANAIDVFAPGATGNVAPERVIQGPDTALGAPTDVKVDAAGDVYSSNFTSDSITEYGPGASGDATPICTISGSNTGLAENDDISLEPDGTLFVGNFESSLPVEVFAPGACGNVAPLRTIAGSLTGLSLVDGIGADAAGTLYADNTDAASIEAFAPGANGNVAPATTISGALTELTGPNDVVVGFGGELYVTNGFGFGSTNSVEVFSSGASGNVAPARFISGSNTGFAGTDDLAVDTTGTIYVTDSGAGDVPIFGPSQNGNVAPEAVLGGSLTTFSEPEGVAVAGPPAAASATLTTTASASTIPLGGGSIHDTAVLAGGTTPTGSIEFKLFGPGDPTCSGAPAYTSPFSTVSGDGSYPSPSFAPVALGTYSWVALYSGDMNNAEVSTACGDTPETVTVTVTKATSSVTTSLSGGGSSGAQISVFQNTAVTDSATLSGAAASTATGTVTYDVYSDSACNVPKSTGTAETIMTPGTLPQSSAVTLSTTGTYYWQASYSGDANNLPSKSTCGTEVETVLAPTALGAFVVGDVSAGRPTTGNSVNFWGAQWAKKNAFSGGGAPSSMKGFADDPVVLTCGSTWTTRPGNSSAPPATLPGTIDVIVSSHVTKSGSTISGNILHIVVVQVNPGYGPNPGHPGTGKIIGTVC